MQTQERSTVGPAGLFRRLILGRPSDEAPLAPGSHPVVDLSMVPADEWQMAATIRIERLEQGLRLMAGTMRRALVELHGRLDDVRQEVVDRMPAHDVSREVARALEPISGRIEELSDEVARVPYILAAAADDLTDRMTALRSDLLGLPELDPDPFEEPAGTLPSELPELLPVVPFELEPLDLEAPTA